jgi:2Fe-2S ferredoxin
VEPSGLTFHAEPHETLMEAARRNGLTWPTVCGGEGSCRTCFVVVTMGSDRLSQIAALEQRGIDDITRSRAYEGPVRLACQAHALGDIVVKRRGVRPDRALAESE